MAYCEHTFSIVLLNHLNIDRIASTRRLHVRACLPRSRSETASARAVQTAVAKDERVDHNSISILLLSFFSLRSIIHSSFNVQSFISKISSSASVHSFFNFLLLILSCFFTPSGMAATTSIAATTPMTPTSLLGTSPLSPISPTPSYSPHLHDIDDTMRDSHLEEVARFGRVSTPTGNSQEEWFWLTLLGRCQQLLTSQHVLGDVSDGGIHMSQKLD